MTKAKTIFKHAGPLDQQGFDKHEIPTIKDVEYVITCKALKSAADPAGSSFTPKLGMKPPVENLTSAGGEFIAAGDKVTIWVSDAKDGTGEYELEVKTKEVLPQLLQPAREWHNDEEVGKGESRRYRIPTEKNKRYILHVRGGSVSIEIDGRPQSDTMSRTFTGTGDEVMLEVTGSGKYGVWCSLKKT